MADGCAGLADLTLAGHGDARERDVWPDVAGSLSNYETFWRDLIVLLTNRVVPVAVAGPEWVRLRPSIPVEYEQMAMHNYSLFYYAAMAWRAIEDDRKRLASGTYPRPERIFAAMRACVEQAKPLQTLARSILRRVGMGRPKVPKHPQNLYETIGAYRNAFAHDPVLGRAVNQGRELLPPKDRLPKHGSPLLWRDAAAIPTAEMIDGLKLENDLWRELAEFLQAQWKELNGDQSVFPARQDVRELGISKAGGAGPAGIHRRDAPCRDSDAAHPFLGRRAQRGEVVSDQGRRGCESATGERSGAGTGCSAAVE